MIRYPFEGLGRALGVILAAWIVASCSSSVSGPAPVTDPNRITILPAEATLYSGLPTTFVINGGTGSYIVSSNNQAVIQVSGPVRSPLVIVPNPVLVDTPVTLTVRDTGTTPVATATLTVRPGTVHNDVSVTPSATQGGTCDPAVCSGGDAEVRATLSQGGLPLPARGVRFEVISGDFRFITSAAGAPETLGLSVDTITDERGEARARIRATANAANQTAILQVTDLGTGAFQRTSFLIAQATDTSPGFFVTPTSVTFVGPREDQCLSGGRTEHFIFGGVAPYVISNTAPQAFSVNRQVVSASGGSFTVTSGGVCVAEPGLPIVVTDAAGRTVSVLAANIPGTEPVPALVAAPEEISLSSCTSIARITVAGGTGRYTASPGSGSLLVQHPSTSEFTVQRLTNSAATTGSVMVGISDGQSTVTVTVSLIGEALGSCPPPSIVPAGTTVTLSDCATAQEVVLSGTPPFTATPHDSGIVTDIVSSGTPVTYRLRVQRRSGSASFTNTTVDLRDAGTAAGTVTVTATGAGTDPCP